MDRAERNQREMRIITVVALCVAVICLSVAYAAMNQTLKVSGEANIIIGTHALISECFNYWSCYLYYAKCF